MTMSTSTPTRCSSEWGWLLLLEQALHARLHFGGQQGDRFEKVLLREPAHVGLKEVTHVPHVCVEGDDAVGDLIRIADVEPAVLTGLCFEDAPVLRCPAAQASHPDGQVVPARVEPVERLLFVRCDEAEGGDGHLAVFPGVSGLRCGTRGENP